ncbi:threonine--tRNA ligase [Lachnoclostridium phytofermentans]|uniref:threonine--tRNA ligase n=1 Tax=Lachnoclostridium phytofermentans TaxID=66219 RepID=UPI0009DCDFD4|nr:threonine--tRNA ligase [Lachnoclostridium phytofermentans]
MKLEYFSECYRHSLAHILAKAVIELFGRENVKLGIGPQIDEGFYYDFLLPRSLTPDDFETIENKMREILKRKEDFVYREVSRYEAFAEFADQPFKKELISELPDNEVIRIYNTGNDFKDLCRGPHVENTTELLNCSFEIKAVSSAYWKGNENNDILQRVYVFAFENKEDLKAHLAFLKEAKERDHKILGPQLDLFFMDATAPGMPYWLPRGWKLFNTILDFWREEHEKRGYQEISSPLINHNSLWMTSGHWDHYQHNMFTIDIDENTIYGVKPMNCPNSIVVYKRRNRSYKELPLRLSDCDVLHRKEKSGELNGLLRVQMFRQDDSHNFITEDQIYDEVNAILDIADLFYGIFGLEYRPELSTRPEHFMGDIELWDKAEVELKEILDNRYGVNGYDINEGDGAFYGPKIDIMMKDALKRQWQMGTIQLDFQLPRNFDISYTDYDGKAKVPVIIHRVIYGSLERFIGIIIENFKGSFPFWISPVQVGIVPISEKHVEYTKEVISLLQAVKVRFEAELSETHMNKKIKYFRNYRVPYVLVLGDSEVENRTVSINIRGGKQLKNIPVDDFVALCSRLLKTRALNLADNEGDIKLLLNEQINPPAMLGRI